MSTLFVALVLAVGLAHTAAPTALPAATVPPPHAVDWDGPPAASMRLDLQPLDISPDGGLRVLARVELRAADGSVTHLRGGGDFDFFANHGRVQWQTRLRYGGPAAIVRVADFGGLAVRVVANDPTRLGSRRAALTLGSTAGGVVARPLGSRRIGLGWFPRVRTGVVRIERSGDGPPRTVRLPPPATGWTDTAVRPGGRYRYVVRRPGADPIILAVDVPFDLPATAVAAVRGKSAWLAFSGAAGDPDGYPRLDAAAIAAQAAAAGLHAVFIRLAYGEFWEATPAAAPALDAVIDALAARGIATIGWTVPREPTFEDVGTGVAAAAYRTPAGNRIAGLAIDLERGDEYFGGGPAARDAMAGYVRRLRAALGPRMLIVATVEDPALEHLDDRAVPYAAIAAASDVVQPMTYWRALHGGVTPERARAAIVAAAQTVRRLAGPRVALAVGAQTADIGHGTGAPSPAEVIAVTRAARRVGAVGITYYDWFGTSPELWRTVTSQQW